MKVRENIHRYVRSRIRAWAAFKSDVGLNFVRTAQHNPRDRDTHAAAPQRYFQHSPHGGHACFIKPNYHLLNPITRRTETQSLYGALLFPPNIFYFLNTISRMPNPSFTHASNFVNNPAPRYYFYEQ